MEIWYVENATILILCPLGAAELTIKQKKNIFKFKYKPLSPGMMW